MLTWLNRLTNGRVEPVGNAPERLIAVTAHGDILAEIDGAGSHVVLGVALDARCLQPGAEIVLVHNHPSSTGLSLYDLGQLAKPGVRAIVAIGHDGSLYAAAAGPRYPGDQFGDHMYLPARAEAEGELRRVAAYTTDLRAFLPHVMSTALAQAGVPEFASERSGLIQQSLHCA